MSNAKTIISNLRENLYDFTMNERMKNKKLYDIIEKYAMENKLFISNPYKICNIDGVIEYLFDFHYAIYCENPLIHANNLTNLFYEELKDEKLINMLVMNTNVKNEEFVISYDNRFIARIYSIQRNKPKGATDLSTLLTPMIINGIQYLPPEIEIIDVYSNLYNGINLNISIKLEEIMYNSIMKNKSVKSTIIDKKENQSCQERKRNHIEAIKFDIIKNFLTNRDDIAVLGGCAIEYIKSDGNACPKYDRLQLLGNLQVSEFKSELEKYLSQYFRGFQLSMSKELDLLIPKDFRTKRTIFCLSLARDTGVVEKPFLEYFNSCTYELIPVFEFRNVLIANKYVLLRILFVDMWISKFVSCSGKQDESVYNAKQARILELIKYVGKMPFYVDGTLGVFYDYEISKKEKKIDQEQFFAPYIPHQYSNTYKKLRKIGGDEIETQIQKENGTHSIADTNIYDIDDTY